MAEAVIDHLEAIQIQDGEARFLPAVTPADHFPAQRTAVWQAGQAVRHHLPTQLTQRGITPADRDGSDDQIDEGGNDDDWHGPAQSDQAQRGRAPCHHANRATFIITQRDKRVPSRFQLKTDIGKLQRPADAKAVLTPDIFQKDEVRRPFGGNEPTQLCAHRADGGDGDKGDPLVIADDGCRWAVVPPDLGLKAGERSCEARRQTDVLTLPVPETELHHSAWADDDDGIGVDPFLRCRPQCRVEERQVRGRCIDGAGHLIPIGIVMRIVGKAGDHRVHGSGDRHAGSLRIDLIDLSNRLKKREADRDEKQQKHRQDELDEPLARRFHQFGRIVSAHPCSVAAGA